MDEIDEHLHLHSQAGTAYGSLRRPDYAKTSFVIGSVSHMVGTGKITTPCISLNASRSEEKLLTSGHNGFTTLCQNSCSG